MSSNPSSSSKSSSSSSSSYPMAYSSFASTITQASENVFLKSKVAFDLLSCGFVSGVLQAILFNPWDRALYLSIKVMPYILKLYYHLY